jgi:hypothetical protein
MDWPVECSRLLARAALTHSRPVSLAPPVLLSHPTIHPGFPTIRAEWQVRACVRV